MKFLHVMIRVKDINKSLKFYQDLFDMNLVNEMELEDSKLYFLSDEDGQTQIELTYNFDTPKNGYINGDAFGHFAFSIKNMDKLIKRQRQPYHKFISTTSRRMASIIDVVLIVSFSIVVSVDA